MSRFPPIEPYETGMLDVGDGASMYWECSGNPNGVAALYLHGGPGSGCTPGSRRYFDPERFRIICLDQRGCGRSRPLASDDGANLRFNTTAHLIADIEHLRRRLGVDRWIVVGVSWGTTLALAYAQQNPQCVRGIVLALVTTTSRREVQWITHDVGRIFPEQFQRFREFVPDELRAVPIVDAYAKNAVRSRLHSPQRSRAQLV